jgi:hypothetical protein
VNLKPYYGSGQPVRVRNPGGGPFTEKTDLVLDWFIENEGPENVVGSYFIDIYLDEILTERWAGGNISPNHFLFVEGFTELLELFNLTPGTHTVKLVADPTNQINESSDDDNRLGTEFIWEGQAAPTPIPGERLPNLSLNSGTGNPAPMTVAPFTGAVSSGGLSIHGDTHISISILNDSPVSIDQKFSVHIFFDDIVVRRAEYAGLLGGNTLLLDWDGLGSVVPITAGVHTLKLVVDATGIVTESNEDDNSFELELVWGADSPLPAPGLPANTEAPARPPQALANLTGYTPYGWDAAITVSHEAEGLALGRDGTAWAAASATISFAIRNSSRINTASSGAFRAEVFVDDEPFGSRLFYAGSDAGSFWTESVVVPANRITAGQHLVKVVIDTDQVIPEDDETDNSVARYVTWRPGTPASETPVEFSLSDEQLDELLAPVLGLAFTGQVRPAAGSGLDLPDWIPVLKSAGRAGYYLLTGRDLDAERIVVHFLPHDQFVAAALASCMKDHLVKTEQVYLAEYAACRDFGGEVGFENRRDGNNHVFVDLGISPLESLGTYFHEVGHALQDITNPSLSTTTRTANVRALLEAQAQIFEAAALRAIEEHSGVSFMRFPDIAPMQEAVDFALTTTNNLTGSADHSLGYKVLWMESLADTSGLETRAELLDAKRLSWTTARALYDYLVAMQPSEVDPWVDDIFSVSPRADQFMTISRSRMEADLATSDSGNPGLREAAFLIP